MHGRFIALVVIVSGLAVLALRLLIGSADTSKPVVVAAGTAAALALVGTLVLARAVVVAERHRGRP